MDIIVARSLTEVKKQQQNPHQDFDYRSPNRRGGSLIEVWLYSPKQQIIVSPEYSHSTIVSKNGSSVNYFG